MYMYYHHFCHCKVVEETGVPAGNHRITPSHWWISHMPLPGSQAVWENALDHLANEDSPNTNAQKRKRRVVGEARNNN